VKQTEGGDPCVVHDGTLQQGRSGDSLRHAICSIVRAELVWGARNSRRSDENLRRVLAFAEPFLSLPFDDASAEHHGLIRADLAAAGQPIGPNDTLIAAIARAHEGVLVTRNVRAFSRVSGLQIEAW
jgi:tRNA(fMet)-specific endonuclease VapC